MPATHVNRPSDVTLRRMAQRAAHMDEIIAFCDEQPRTLPKIAEALGVSVSAAGSLADSLRRAGLLKFIDRNRIPGIFVTPRLAALMNRPLPSRSAASPDSTTPGVSVAQHKEWLRPAPVQVAQEQHTGRTVTVTRIGPPPERFAVEIAPGTGVISQDNPGLAMLAARMAGIAAVQRAQLVRGKK